MGGDVVRPRELSASEVRALEDGRATEEGRPADLGPKG